MAKGDKSVCEILSSSAGADETSMRACCGKSGGARGKMHAEHHVGRRAYITCFAEDGVTA